MDWIDHFLEKSNQCLYGKTREAQLALTCLLTGGHLLIEDTPGVGKTTLAKFLAKELGLKLTRIQFTNDLLPSDILGSNVFDTKSGDFKFSQGPIFGEVILADELNRGNSKTQSALLQAMEEKRVSIDGVDYNLPKEHILIATQNPNSQVGTFPLPESQLDRFLMKISMGPPSRENEGKLLSDQKGEQLSFSGDSSITKEKLLEDRRKILSYKPSQGIVDYILDLLEFSRSNSETLGLSPRSGIDLINALKVRRVILKKNSIDPEDVQELFPYVMGHRLVDPNQSSVSYEQEVAKSIIQKVHVY